MSESGFIQIKCSFMKTWDELEVILKFTYFMKTWDKSKKFRSCHKFYIFYENAG